MTIPELLDWCEEHHDQPVYVHRDREAGQVALYVDDGALTVPVELWDELAALIAKHRPDVTIEPEP